MKYTDITEIIIGSVILFILMTALMSLLWISSEHQYEASMKCKEMNGTFISRSNVCVKKDAVINLK